MADFFGMPFKVDSTIPPGYAAVKDESGATLAWLKMDGEPTPKAGPLGYDHRFQPGPYGVCKRCGDEQHGLRADAAVARLSDSPPAPTPRVLVAGDVARVLAELWLEAEAASKQAMRNQSQKIIAQNSIRQRARMDLAKEAAYALDLSSEFRAVIDAKAGPR